MRSVGDHSELPLDHDAVYEPRTQTGDEGSNLDQFEELLAAAERASKPAAGATAAGPPERIGVPLQSFVQSQK